MYLHTARTLGIIEQKYYMLCKMPETSYICLLWQRQRLLDRKVHFKQNKCEEKSNRIRLLGKFWLFQMEEFIYNFSICVCNFICHSKLFWLDVIPKITLLNVNWVLSQRFSYSQCVVFLLITDSAIRTVIKIIMNNFRMFALFISISWLKERNKSKYSSASLYSIRKWDQLAHGIWTFKLNYYTMTTKTNHIRSRRLLFFIEH